MDAAMLGPAPTKAEALKTGAVTYASGTCHRCGSTERYAKSGACLVCEKLKNLLRYEKVKKHRKPPVQDIPWPVPVRGEDAIAAAYKGERYDRHRKARIEP